MNQPDSFGTPTLVVLTGRPASGKTTLANALARVIRCPMISRDSIKEGLVNTLQKNGVSENAMNGYVYGVYFDTLDRLLRSHITLVTEAAFQHKVWHPKLTAFGQIATLKLICCDIDVEIAKARFIERGIDDPNRAKFHDDLSAQLNVDLSQTLIGRYEPPTLDFPTLTVDTSDGYQPPIEDILAFIDG